VFEWGLNQACESRRCLWADIGLHDLKHLQKGIVEHMMGVLGMYTYLDQGWFYSLLVSGVGWGSEILLEQVQLYFSFQNRFIIVLLCGHQVDNQRQ
jgi:hypothetical protein